MSTNSFFAKFLRFIGIVLMALTGGFTLLGGAGTTCAALFPTKYDSMTALAPFQWLYILFVFRDRHRRVGHLGNDQTCQSHTRFVSR